MDAAALHHTSSSSTLLLHQHLVFMNPYIVPNVGCVMYRVISVVSAGKTGVWEKGGRKRDERREEGARRRKKGERIFPSQS